MRPLRLELAGFASFVEPTVVDFDDTDLFVLTGPTGAGKSSLIDAMVFALYGSVPRYDDRRVVAPVITQGRNEARVRLTFAVGEQTWAATRVVRRTARGATTKEARLERVLATGDTKVVAGNAEELTDTVHRLLGLRFEHFTRTVVLPQGDVHEFLHASPKERQDLLVELLGLDVYRAVASRARTRATAEAARVEQLTERLEELAGVTPETLAEAKAHREAVAGLRPELDAARAELEELEERGRAARAAAEEAAGRLRTVEGLTVPSDVGTLAADVTAAREAVEGARTAETEALQALAAAEERLAALPDAGAVEAIVRAHEAVTARTATRDRAAAHATEVGEAAAQERAAAERAREEAEGAATALHAAERAQLATTLTADLEVGAPCPVCTQVVTALPEGDATPDLDAARARAEATARDARTAERAAGEAERAAAAATATAEAASTALEEALADRATRAGAVGLSPDDAAGAATVAGEVATAGAAVTEARTAARAATADRTAAEERLTAAERAAAAAWEAFDAARDRLAALSPPAVDRTDLAAAWQGLSTFAAERAPELRTAAAAAQEAITAAEQAWRDRMARLREAVAAGGVEPTAGAGLRDVEAAVVAAVTTAEARVTHIAQQLETVAELRERRSDAERARDLAAELGRQLDAKHFERWLLTQALQRLLHGATARLDELTAGAYSLTVDASGVIEVVDHRNADERRPVKTLSGGETFLASLALALALADQVAELASGGAARLEALFLDEGFGTLDGETLDTVATAISELGQQGRMVGIVTHIRELAEQIPVRYEVRKVGGSSSVERIET